ncbi:MAG: hypothetical protein J6575_03580 [Bifidobacterium sp.]|nr:hypothetical protein [Bifidobacterium sp.]
MDAIDGTGIMAEEQQLNDLQAQALNVISLAFTQFVQGGMRGEANGYANSDDGVLVDELDARCRDIIDEDTGQPEYEWMEQTTALSPLGLGRLDEKAKSIYHTDYLTAKQRYDTALMAEIDRQLGIDNR